MESGAARTQTSARRGSQCLQGKDLSLSAIMPGPTQYNFKQQGLLLCCPLIPSQPQGGSHLVAFLKLTFIYSSSKETEKEIKSFHLFVFCSNCQGWAEAKVRARNSIVSFTRVIGTQVLESRLICRQLESGANLGLEPSSLTWSAV